MNIPNSEYTYRFIHYNHRRQNIERVASPVSIPNRVNSPQTIQMVQQVFIQKIKKSAES